MNLGLIFWIFLSLCCAQTVVAPRSDIGKTNFPANWKTVAIRPSASGSHVALVVDQDQRVRFIFMGERPGFPNEMTLGFEVTPPTEFQFAKEISKDEVLVELFRQSSSTPEWKVWVAQTVGLLRNEDIETREVYIPAHRLQILEASPSSRKVLVAKTYPRIDRLVFDDVNGDGLTDIFVHYNSSKVGYSGLIEMWSISKQGVLETIQLQNVMANLKDGVETDFKLGDYDSGDYSLRREDRIAIEDGWRVIHKSYKWNGAKRQYAFVNETRIEEKIIR